MTLISSTKSYSKSHPVWLCDIWGVVHNGVTPFKTAVDALISHREAGGIVILISNSPRPKPSLIEQLDLLNVGPQVYDGVVSSGDVTRALVEERMGKTVFHLGPDRDKGIFKNLQCTFGDAESADYIVCSGLLDDTTEIPEDYRSLLETCSSKNLTMICANPDIKVQRGEELVYCAGALAALYEEIDGEVIYAGKPHLPIYERAIGLAAGQQNGDFQKSQILAIGDGAHTDAAGAAAFGCDFLFISGGLHKAETGEDDALDDSQASQLSRKLCEATPDLKVVGVAPVLA